MMRTKLLMVAVASVFLLSSCASTNETPQQPAGQSQPQASSETWSQYMENLKGDLDKALKDTGIEANKAENKNIRVNIVHKGKYASGSTQPAPNLRKGLKALAETLKAYPNTTVTIVGYTDSKGKDAKNMKLSEKRAAMIKKYLVRQGVNTDNITIEGRGESNPVASNDTAQGRAQNRRVEIYIAEKS